MDQGINGSRLDVLGFFRCRCTINQVLVNIVFGVVSDTAMQCDALLRRDFISLAHIKISFDDKNVVIVIPVEAYEIRSCKLIASIQILMLRNN